MGDGRTESDAERRPADGYDGAGDGVPHDGNGLTQQEDLNLVPGGGQGIGMEKGEGSLGGIVGTPGALYEDLVPL